MKRVLAAILFTILPGAAQIVDSALARITKEALQGDLAYLASDQLAGRDTPSPGLELAANYIAAQFKKDGLEPAGPDGSYFQIAHFERVTPPADVLVDLATGKRQMRSRARVRSDIALDYTDAVTVKLPEKGPLPSVEGQIVVGEARVYGRQAGADELRSGKPALIVLIGQSRNAPPSTSFLEDPDTKRIPQIQILDSDAAALLRSDAPLLISVHVPQPKREEIPLRNVAGILRGSDPAFRDQYVILSAHYDHIGQTSQGIFHGADDNASGTASVIEIGNALASMNPHPKRSILFLTFFGEEKGLLGSTYYTHHPLVPLRDTVANINLEQMGRTDDTTGPKIASFFFTGQSYSDVPALMAKAAKQQGVQQYRRDDSDDYFDRSDNLPFAKVGVVDHTIAVAAEFPGYHGLADTLDKIDFTNMAKVDRAVAAGIVAVAADADPPKWSDSKAVAKYKEMRLSGASER
jgi:hypothetical protein